MYFSLCKIPHFPHFMSIFAEDLFYICFTMATFKVLVLPHQKKEDGSYNVKVRITHNRKVKYIRTPYYVDGKDIRKVKGELKIKNQAILDVVDEMVIRYRKKIAKAGMDISSWSLDRLVLYLESDPSKFSLDFIDYGRNMADSILASGRTSTGKMYHCALNALVRVLGRNTLDVKEITVQFLKGLEKSLRNENVIHVTHEKRVDTKKKKTGRSLLNYMRIIRAIHEAAKYDYNDEENGVINIPYSPFSKYKMPEAVSSKHRVLTIEQMQKIIDYPYTGKNTNADMAKDVFVMSFAMMGINTADLYEVSSLDGDILAYNRKKTRGKRTDKALMKVRIEAEIKGLLGKYKGNDKLFCFSEKYKDEKAFNRAVNSGLEKIGEAIGVKGLTYYYARHTMASICANKLGIDIARVDEMLNHSDPKLALARVYIEKDFKPLWEANRRLLDLFDWSFYKEKAEE